MKVKLNRALCVLGLIAASTTVFAQDIKNSFVTVEQLLTIDNEQALRKAQEDAVRVGLLSAPASKGATVIEEPLPQWAVKSISGASGYVKADILIDRQEKTGVEVGQTVGSCQVVSIADACVQLKPLNKKVRAGMCPSKVCWTGEEIAMQVNHPQNVQPAGTPNSKPMPSPLPLPASTTQAVVGSTGGPVTSPVKPAR